MYIINLILNLDTNFKLMLNIDNLFGWILFFVCDEFFFYFGHNFKLRY